MLIPGNMAAGKKADALIERVLASEAFRKSPKLKALFRYLAQHSLNNEPELLSEQQVGIAVFGRPPGYNATDDSVVRVQVHNLREHLAGFFAGEGGSEPIVATIPKGRYCLVFGPRSTTPAPEPAVPAPQAHTLSERTLGSPARTALIFVMAFVLGIAGHSFMATSGIGTVKALPATQELPPNPVLGSVLTPANQTIVVIEDTALVMASLLRGEPFSLAEFVAANGHSPDFSGVFASDVVRRRVESLIPKTMYINLANATFAIRLLRSYPRLSEKAVFRHPREIQMRDIRSTNCILFGGQLSNPWVDLYEDSLNFHLRPFTAGTGFENRRPKPGERTSYGDTQGGDKLTYARIAVLPNFEAGTRALILTGMGGPETEAAAQFLLASDFLEQLPPQLRAQLGAPPPYLEILLSASRVGTTVGRTQIVAWRASKDAGPPSDSR